MTMPIEVRASNGRHARAPIINFAEYLRMEREDLKLELARTVSELAACLQDEAMMLADERNTQSREWIAADGASVTYRDRAAKYATTTISASIFEIRGKINRLKEQRDLLYFLIKDMVVG